MIDVHIRAVCDIGVVWDIVIEVDSSMSINDIESMIEDEWEDWYWEDMNDEGSEIDKVEANNWYKDILLGNGKIVYSISDGYIKP